MTWLSVALTRCCGLFQRQRRERELDDEVRFHLDMQIEDNLRSGMNPEQARSAARRSFGPIEPMKERYRERWAFIFFETAAQDVRFALRSLRRSPGFTTTSVATLALAIGANTAMFSVLNAVLLRPLPFQDPERLVMLWSEIPSQGIREGRVAYRTAEQWQNQSRSFAAMAVFDPVSATLTRGGETEQISVGRVSPNFFTLLGVHPLLGRGFSDQEAEQRQPLVIISQRFWQSHFAASSDALGASLDLDGVSSRVIGVLPAGSQLAPLDADLWEPHTTFPDWERRRNASGAGSWFVLGRLGSHVTLAQAQTEMSAISRRLAEQASAPERDRTISVVPLSLQLTGTRPRLALWMLACAVACVLLIAATNVASLSLARSASRERELAIRAALGAGHGRIVRQLLTESLTLTVASGLLGLLVAAAGIRFILFFKPVNLARLSDIGLDPQALAWAFALSVVTGILVGLAPAMTLARRNLRPDGGRGTSGGVAARRVRRALVVAEFAMAIILLVGAGLLLRSLWSVQRVDLGYRPERVLSMQLSNSAFKAASQQVDFYSRVLEQVQALPGIESAGIVGDLFVAESPEQIVTTEGNSPGSERLQLRRDEVSENFFATLRTPLLRGRLFAGTDGPTAPRVAIVNDVMARRLWPGHDAIGKRFRLGSSADSPWFTVVGVAGNMRRRGLEREPGPQMFEPLAQNPSRLSTLLVRTAADDPVTMVKALQAAVHRVDPHAPLYGITTLEDRLGSFLTQRRFETSLLIGFAVVALLLSAIGIYGLIQYSIATRTHEIAIRIAVGAEAGDILRMTIREGLKLSLTGLFLGLMGAVLLSRDASSLLFGVTATDPLTFTMVSVLLCIVATAACYFPARQAARVEPVTALRQT